MGFTCSFLHNQTYTADDVNKAFARLTTQGVSLFQDTGDTLTDLDTATSNLIENGIELFNNDACKVVQIADGQYKVMPGTAFMPNGEAITVDEEGYTFTAELGTAWNVVMFVSANAGYIQAQEDSAPADGITIATIAADGTITDARTFAKTKVAPATANVYLQYTIPSYMFKASMDKETPYHTIDTGAAWFQYIMITTQKGTAIVPVAFELTEGAKTDFIRPTGSGSIYIAFQKRGQYIDVYGEHTGSGGSEYYFDAVIF